MRRKNYSKKRVNSKGAVLLRAAIALLIITIFIVYLTNSRAVALALDFALANIFEDAILYA